MGLVMFLRYTACHVCEADSALLWPLCDGRETRFAWPSNYYEQPLAQQQELVNVIIANNWRNKFAKPLAQGFAISLTIGLAVYGLVRAIGWVIGGFAAL